MSERRAAAHYAARIGKDSVLRQALTWTDDNGDNRGLKEIANQAVGANASSLSHKAPDLVKGSPAAAFSSMTGEDLVSLSKGSMATYIKHLGSMPAGQERDFAVSAFRSSVQAVHDSTELRGKFDSESGREIVKLAEAARAHDPGAVATTDEEKATKAMLEGLKDIGLDGMVYGKGASIDSTGKIR